MLRLVIIVFLFLTEGCLAHDAFGPFESSCAAFLKTRTDPAFNLAYNGWLTGFVTSYNVYTKVYNRGTIATFPDSQAIIGWVEKFCADHPISPLLEAAIKVVVAGRAQ